MQSRSLISRVLLELAKQQGKKAKTKSDLLAQTREALRAVLMSKDYTLDASSLLKEIDTHPETARRFLDDLCPTSDYEPLWKLFNYEEIVHHIETYIRDQDIAQIEKDMRLLRNRLKIFLGNEREVKFWGRKVNWTKNVTIPIPSLIMRGNSYDKDGDQKIYSQDRSSKVILDHNNKIQEVVIQVLETGTPNTNTNRLLFTIRLEPIQKTKGECVKIILHSYASKDPSKTVHNTRSRAMEIPLHIEDRSKGLTVYSINERSIIPTKPSRWYLHADLNEIGYSKINSIEKRIEKIQSDANIPSEKRREIVRQYQTARKKVINKRQYQLLTVKTKGLLLYSLVESDHKEFNEVIENISKCNRYDVNHFDPYYDEKIWVPFQNLNHLDPVRKIDFPFLLDYYKFKHVLQENFAFNVLKRIAGEFQSRLETISPLELRFEVTARFFIEVKGYLWKSILSNRRIDYVDDTVFSVLNNYHSIVGSYVRRRQRLILAFEDQIWGKEIRYNRLRLRGMSSQKECNID
ncbi:MAG: hypothetical protein GEU26_01210 [Nitrososphaeraceae archaeon]|nr:hypothetical protein [Nitrososphaeraceae archaeon]